MNVYIPTQQVTSFFSILSKVLILVFAFGLSSFQSNGQDFYLAENGVTCMCPDAEIGESGTLEINGQQRTFTKRTREQITPENAASTCTSGITDMSELFKDQENFNEDISHWDVSLVTNMSSMFYLSRFNQSIGNWDVSKVTNMGLMFSNYYFNKPIGNWDVSNVINMEAMFQLTPFNQSIGNWDVGKVINMGALFFKSDFNQPINNWDVSEVENMEFMFYESGYNQPLAAWDVSKVDNMSNMFKGAIFNFPIGSWNVSEVTNMLFMFQGSQFNQDISNWCVENFESEPRFFSTGGALSQENQPVWGTCPDNIEQPKFYLADNGVTCMCPDAEIGESGTLEINGQQRTFTKRTREQITPENAASTCTSGITDMRRLFEGNAEFNEDISHWDVSAVTGMAYMFFSTSFNQPIGSWDVSNVKGFESMFRYSPFNQPLANWDVSSCISMELMFHRSSFNQPIGNWNVSNVTIMGGMFAHSQYNHPLEDWDVSNVTSMTNMFGDSEFNQPIGNWNVSNVTLMNAIFSSSEYNHPLEGWDVSNVTNMASMFSYSSFNQPLGDWDVSSAVSMFNMFSNSNYNYPLDSWDVSNVLSMRSMFENSQYNFPLDIWNVSKVTSMSSMFAKSQFNHSINNWDVGSVVDMSNMFEGSQFNLPLTNWNVSNVTNMTEMFKGAENFNEDISTWDVSTVTNMGSMFRLASSFNQPIGIWDVSSVTDMSFMFYGTLFNQPIDNWNVSNVTTMTNMFVNDGHFNQDISMWDVSNVTDMSFMFYGARSFNQPIGGWDVSNVTDMWVMLAHASSFNQDINSWSVSKVTEMRGMFFGAFNFNQPLNNWDVSSVQSMWDMFKDARVFNQSLGSWDVGSVTNMDGIFNGAENFNQDISNWCVVNFDSEPLEFSLNAPLKEEFKPIWGTCPESEPLPNPPSVDSTPPLLVEFNFSSTYIQSSVSEYLINFHVSDESFLDTVRIFYKPIRSENRANWLSTVNAVVGNTSVVGGAFDLPNSAFDEIGTMFYLRAVDSNNNVLNTDTMYVYRAYDSNDPLSLQTPSSGVSANDFFLFGIPLMLNPNTVGEVITPNFGGVNSRLWRMFYADGAQNIETTPSTPINTGDGYWMISANPRTLNFSGTVPNVRVDSTFNLSVNAGWNLISNPYPFPMSWNAVLASNGNTQTVRTPLGFDGAYVEKSTLQTFEGAYIFALEATSLAIPVENLDNARKDDLLAKPVFAGNNWSINFDLNTESGKKFQLAGLGMHEEALEDFDSFDNPLVPRMPNYIDLQFTDKRILGIPFMKDVVSPQENYTWDMEVRSSQNGEKATIRWAAQNPQKGMGLLLVDTESGEKIDMLKTNEYSFTLNGPRRLSVDYVKIASNEPESSIFNPFLGQPFPNPTTDNVTIPYSLPVGINKYVLKLVDLNGRDIAVVEEGLKAEGNYDASYNVNSLPQGVYLIVLDLPESNSGSMIKKLMVR